MFTLGFLRGVGGSLQCRSSEIKNRDHPPLIGPILSKGQVNLIKHLLSAPLQLQLTSTSAYYTYLLLLLKSVVYLAIIASCLFRRTEVCGDGKSS